MRISDWSSDVCSSDLTGGGAYDAEPRTMSSRLAVFDCDGTLVDGQAEVCDAMEAAFVEAGLPPPSRNTVRRSVGLSLNAAMRQLVPDAEIGRASGRERVCQYV